MLANLKERSGIERAIATVKTTGDKTSSTIRKGSAREWDIGAVQSKESSLLLVVSTMMESFSRRSPQRQRRLARRLDRRDGNGA